MCAASAEETSAVMPQVYPIAFYSGTGSMLDDIEPLQLGIQPVLAVGVNLIALQLGVLPGRRQHDGPAAVSTSSAI